MSKTTTRSEEHAVIVTASAEGVTVLGRDEAFDAHAGAAAEVVDVLTAAGVEEGRARDAAALVGVLRRMTGPAFGAVVRELAGQGT